MFIGPDTTCFVMDPTRAAGVLARHAGIDQETGQLAADGDGAAAAGDLQRLLLRLYLSRQQGGRPGRPVLLGPYPAVLRAGRETRTPAQLRYWTEAWLERIKNLYAAHEELMAAWAAAAASAARQAAAAAARLAEARAAWDAALGTIDTARQQQMAAPGLQKPAKKALATLDREWDGLAAHRGYPMISLDNNAAERALRRPVVTRKKAYGSRNERRRPTRRPHLDRHRHRRDGRAERPDLPHRLPRRLRAQRRQAARRPGPGTIPALER